jgi:signal peptide peptidase SppA
MQLHRIAARVLNRPLLIVPHNAEIICSVLADRIGVEPMVALQDRSPDASRFIGEGVAASGGNRRAMYSRVDDTAIVTVEGELVNRGAWIGADSGLTSYEGIDAQLRAAASDPRVRQILLDIESPGGEAVGAMELAATVRKVNKEKPVYAIANGMAASAAYAMASGAKRLFATPSSLTGSIGVVLLHLDQSVRLEKQGIKPTLIFAGAHKVDGHPFGPLPDSVADDLKAEVAQFYQHFVETVAAGRPGLTEQAIRATEARTYLGADAVKVGIADAVSSFDEVLVEVRAAGRSTQVRGAYMSDTTSAPAANNAGISQADHDKAVADAQAAGAKAAQERISAILGLEEAKGRKAQAEHIAFKTSMSVDDAKAMLATAPVEAAKPSVPSLDERMSAQPGLGGDTAQPTGKAAIAKLWDDAVTAVNAKSKRLRAA